MAKGDKQDVARAKAVVAKKQRKATNSKLNMLDREVKNAVKRGATKYGSGSLKDGARKPSMPVKTGVKNKTKAQGAKALSAPTDRYSRRSKDGWS